VDGWVGQGIEFETRWILKMGSAVVPVAADASINAHKEEM
jgi:hypothetical protein